MLALHHVAGPAFAWVHGGTLAVAALVLLGTRSKRNKNATPFDHETEIDANERALHPHAADGSIEQAWDRADRAFDRLR